MIDPETLNLMIRLLPLDLGLKLSREMESLGRFRSRTYEARDTAIRQALSLLSSEANPSGRLATLMAEQVGAKWGKTGNHLVVEAVCAALSLNDGVTMTERQIRNVAAGNRTPRK